MPAKNTIRCYQENGFYHVYNRGVNKRVIFLDEQDYKMFLYYLFVYIADPQIIRERYPKIPWNIKQNNLFDTVLLHTYSLMPNHFHLLLEQRDINGIIHLLKCVTNAYTRYFNQKYDRVGPLVQGVYKAAPVETDEYLLQLSRYIHRNSLSLTGYQDITSLGKYAWDSLRYYITSESSPIVTTETILSYFLRRNRMNSYDAFVSQRDDMVLSADLLLD